MTMLRKAFLVLNLLLGAVLALTPFVLFPVCGPMPNGKYMMCHYSGIFIAGILPKIGRASCRERV